MKIQKKYIILLVLIIVMAAIMPFKVKYRIYSAGRIFPEREWILGRTSDGRLTSTIRNNHLGIISSYGGKEFQRGDVFDFSMNYDVANKKYIKAGEVIGFLQSKDLKRMLNELEDQLKVEQSLLTVYSSGEKSQIRQEAQTSLNLAKEQFIIKEKLLQRKKNLYKDSLIAPQEYDLALNEYETSKINYDLAKAKVQTVSTGEKPEQINFSNQKIASLTNQINNLKERLKTLEINSPFSGMMLQKKSAPSLYQSNAPYLDVLANLADTSTYIVITPVQLKEAKYISIGQLMEVKLFNTEAIFDAEISNIDNVIQIINGKQAIFVTAKVKKHNVEIIPGIIAQTTIVAEELTIYEYSKRLILSLFYR